MDRVAKFSVTPYKQAEEMSEMFLNLPGITEDSTITDGTACVGGNAVSFARHFKRVNAVEMDKERCEMLAHNIEACRKHGVNDPNLAFKGSVYVYMGDCLSFIPRLRQDIVFLDPPWGGKSYKERSAVSLFLSSMPIHDFVAKCAKWCKYVALKLPFNADVSAIKSDPRLQILFRKNFKFVILVVSLKIEENVLAIQRKRNEFTDERMETLLTSLIKLGPFHDVLNNAAAAAASNTSATI